MKCEGAMGPAPLGVLEVGEGDGQEPTYCYCKRVSFGEMIACDSDDCPIEWFHYGCVGIDPAQPPKGKWYCRECMANKKAGGK